MRENKGKAGTLIASRPELGGRTADLQIAGYVLFEALMAIFLFGAGFAALSALTESYLREARQASNLTDAANIAEGHLESLSSYPWEDNFRQGRCWPGGVVQGTEGRFKWQIRSAWDALPDILRVTVEVQWIEEGKLKNYILESAYHVEY